MLVNESVWKLNIQILSYCGLGSTKNIASKIACYMVLMDTAKYPLKGFTKKE